MELVTTTERGGPLCQVLQHLARTVHSSFLLLLSLSSGGSKGLATDSAGAEELSQRVAPAMSSHSQHTTFRDGTQVVSWDTSTVCAQCCDGVASCVPLEPHPLGVEAPSGLSRVAQLSAAQAVGVPFIPSYCHEQGGVVRLWRQLACPVCA